jgi:transcriptional regulator with XRE-family HTH domain
LVERLPRKFGVRYRTYLTWEQGTHRPSTRLWPGLISYLGYDPTATGERDVDQVEAARRRLGWSMREVAAFIRVDPGTLARWRSGRSQPAFAGDRLDEFLSLQLPFATKLGPPPSNVLTLTFAQQLKRRRSALRLSQRAAAEGLGVTRRGWQNWEQQRQRPKAKSWPMLIRFLGYDPLPDARTVIDQVERQRLSLGWTHREVATFMGVVPKTGVALGQTRRHPPPTESRCFQIARAGESTRCDLRFTSATNRQSGFPLGGGLVGVGETDCALNRC